MGICNVALFVQHAALFYYSSLSKTADDTCMQMCTITRGYGDMSVVGWARRRQFTYTGILAIDLSYIYSLIRYSLISATACSIHTWVLLGLTISNGQVY